MRGTLRGVICLLALLAGCAAPQPQPSGVAKRLAFSGYTVLPPLGPGWTRQDPPGADLGFVRSLDASGHRFLLVAATSAAPGSFATPQAFLDYVIARQEHEADPRRFHVLQESVNLDPAIGAYCVRTGASAEDRRTHLVLDAASIVCLHPTKPRLMITVGWSELHRNGHAAPGLAEDGERFIGSLRLFDLQ